MWYIYRQDIHDTSNQRSSIGQRETLQECRDLVESRCKVIDSRTKFSLASFDKSDTPRRNTLFILPPKDSLVKFDELVALVQMDHRFYFASRSELSLDDNVSESKFAMSVGPAGKAGANYTFTVYTRENPLGTSASIAREYVFTHMRCLDCGCCADRDDCDARHWKEKRFVECYFCESLYCKNSICFERRFPNQDMFPFLCLSCQGGYLREIMVLLFLEKLSVYTPLDPVMKIMEEYLQ